MARVQVNRNQPVYQMPGNPAAVRTKKYGLNTKKYVRLAMRHFFKTQWKWAFIPLLLIFGNAVVSLTGVYPNIWIYITVVVLVILYILFWLIQFMGITQLEQYKPMFQKYEYEFEPKQILMKINQKEGGVMKWEQIKDAYREKDAFVLVVTRGQFLYLPYNIFKSDHDLKVMERILKQKNLLPTKFS